MLMCIKFFVLWLAGITAFRWFLPAVLGNADPSAIATITILFVCFWSILTFAISVRRS